MKRPLTIVLLCLGITVSARAQGELQFHQSIYIELEGVAAAGTEIVDSQVLLVPEGRTVKLTSVSVSYGNGPYQIGGGALVFLDGKPLNTQNSSVFASTALPTWLPSGEYLFELQNESNNVNVFRAFVSGVEFNLE